ncbi:hypothetical protein CLV94_1305 [Flavobacterium endophyticum]|uniref:Uncharacterized protein n=1 Tax=Flavobacterium endophyticum TaxID=1540163 RepID=A0A495MLE3_9FLAO|nr:hypothetical protein CLV94_1305 [Flavobacterium endophyticum]
MNFREIIGFLVPIGLIIAGIFIKLSKREELASFKKKWVTFIILGILLFLLRLYTYFT